MNFGAIYGQGAAGLVQSAWAQWGLVLDLTEAKAWLKTFDDTYYGFAQWRRDHYRRCEERLRIVIGKDADREIGRIYPKSRVPEGASFYTRCCNLPVQGACADASMLALAYVDDRLFEAGIDGGPVAWLHDEIVLEVREDQAERAAEILKQSMIDGFADTCRGVPQRRCGETRFAGGGTVAHRLLGGDPLVRRRVCRSTPPSWSARWPCSNPGVTTTSSFRFGHERGRRVDASPRACTLWPLGDVKRAASLVRGRTRRGSRAWSHIGTHAQREICTRLCSN